MTPGPPDEALHFRGKTLTPESPRPLHIPEPANIPVLENQMDPVFNDTSTYERSVYTQVPQTHDGWSHGALKNGQGGPFQTQGAGSFQGSQSSVTQNGITVSAPYYTPKPASGSEKSGLSGSRFSLPDSTHSHTAPVAPVPQGFATASEVDHAHAELSKMNAEKEDVGVNFQNLLDNISYPNPGATIAAVSPAVNTSLHQATAGEALQPQSIPAHTQAQHNSSTQAPYSPNDEVAYEPPSNASLAHAAQSSSLQPQQFSIAPGAAANNPPLSTFPQTTSILAETQGTVQEPSATFKRGRIEKPGRSVKPTDDDSFWGPEVQKKYDEFLHDERVYVTEGLWDRFPMGSRLFVGNLPTERVTKRDMFHIFHKYGKLAQISIKQAYGFIQFLEASSCHAALGVEQGATVRGRKIRRQTSAVPVLGEQTPGPPTIVTTDPSHMMPVGCRSVTFEMNLHTVADGMTIARRAPLPRDLFEGPETGIGHAKEHQRDSIVASEGAPVLRVLHAHPIPETDDIAALAQGCVASMKAKQIYQCLDELSEMCQKNFVLHVENAFRNRGLRVDVLVLGPRIPLGAAVHRQFTEGVLAVVRLSRPNQVSRKIPLQLFDRTAGLDNVRFLDYPELEPNLSAELLSHQAQAMQRGAAPAAFAPNPTFVVPPAQPMAVPPPVLPALSNQPNIANLIGSLDGPSLSSLLSALQRPPHSQPVSATQSPFSSPNPPPADLASLLTNAHRPPPMPATPQQPLSRPPFNLQPSNAPVITDPTLLSLLTKGLGGQQSQGQGPIGPQVQNLMQHLAKWKQ
ncbi:hypothetical protein N7457_008467 [Penicillium paradoxum]|uniref:uncharacterized protein n=1 Tax=Penicillium paradoxum TaxID=176176 RepID=UPI0025499515|nr:uncharacterized protein N7457_008467 [Penicillium paradoxum]KAJ5773571.1 hypothetical protein N7457_008467 [Penicillium paradoxum]